MKKLKNRSARGGGKDKSSSGKSTSASKSSSSARSGQQDKAQYARSLIEALSTLKESKGALVSAFLWTEHQPRRRIITYLDEATLHSQGKFNKRVTEDKVPSLTEYATMAEALSSYEYDRLSDGEKRERIRALAVLARHTYGEDTVLHWDRQGDGSEPSSKQHEGEGTPSRASNLYQSSKQDDQATSKGDTSNEEHFQDMSDVDDMVNMSIQMKARLKQERKALGLAGKIIAKSRTTIEAKPALPPIEAFSESFAGITVRDFGYPLPSSPYVSGGLTGKESYREEGGVLVLDPKDEIDHDFGVYRSDFYERIIKSQDKQTESKGDIVVETEAGEATQAEAEGEVETETMDDQNSRPGETARSTVDPSQSLKDGTQSGPRGILKPQSKEGSDVTTASDTAVKTRKNSSGTRKTVQFEGVD